MSLTFSIDSTSLEFFALPENVHLFSAITRGVEREALRVDRVKASLSAKDHPKALGSALTHPFITTDFSEALIEIVTPPVLSLKELEGSLTQLHQFVYENIENELLWPASMPGSIDEKSIKLAHYGNSNIAKMKYIYRRGLCHRYGRMMQVIAGIHYNFSLPEGLLANWHKASNPKLSLREFIDAAYFKLMRNYFRHYWLLIYLFGASPICSNSSLPTSIPDYLQQYDDSSYYAPYGTSLRMSGLGYNNISQSCIWISRDNVKDYVKDLLAVTHQTYPDYVKLGLKDESGEYKQLNTNILQIENEYYSPIRPKQITRSGERPAIALRERGVKYIEVRSLDVNPFVPTGIDLSQAAFIDVFLVFCLLADCDSLSQCECQEKANNLQKVVSEGRRPGLLLEHNGKAILLTDWAKGMFAELENIAAVMDKGLTKPVFVKAVSQQYQKILNSELTPSAQILQAMREQTLSYTDFMLSLANQHQAYFSQTPMSASIRDKLNQASKQSWFEQTQIEQHDSIDFETFLAHYFAQE